MTLAGGRWFHPKPHLATTITVGGTRTEAADPRTAIEELLVFSSRDWGQDKTDTWLYGIVLGWDHDAEPDGDDAMFELAQRHGWTIADVAQLRRLHEAWGALQ